MLLFLRMKTPKVPKKPVITGSGDNVKVNGKPAVAVVPPRRATVIVPDPHYTQASDAVVPQGNATTEGQNVNLKTGKSKLGKNRK